MKEYTVRGDETYELDDVTDEEVKEIEELFKKIEEETQKKTIAVDESKC